MLFGKEPQKCPYLVLAPMEGVGDESFRKAIATIGGFDVAIKDFLRVHSKSNIQSLSASYQVNEIDPIPLIPQIMGSDPILMGAMASELEKKGAPSIDINCGCPSNTVNGRGAGASLLKDSHLLHQMVSSIVRSVSIPVSVKMRLGYEGTSLFQENLLAVEESGVQSITLHPRTKKDGYRAPAKWEWIAKAKQIVQVPIIGNGDILTVEDALLMLQQTRCDGLMIGRGSIINPFLFREIRSYFAKKTDREQWEDWVSFFHTYVSHFPERMLNRVKVNKLKQMMSFVFKKNTKLAEKRDSILRATFPDPNSFLAFSISLLQDDWKGI